MKYFLPFLLNLFIHQNIMSQDTRDALEVLNQMSDKYKKMNGFTSSFTYSMNNLSENITDSFEGTISVKDEKYILYIEGQKIINDSKTVWTYLEDLNEVTISEFDPTEQEISLNNIFEIYKEGFTHKNIGEKDDLLNIEIYPDSDEKSYFKILFKINNSNLLESFTVFDKSNTLFIYTINNFIEEDLDLSLFTFIEKNYPGIEVIDFR
tara:strand:+ start:40 stop:663 length:624 start_codon:yes stop_codon:yes gene_type:complete